MPLLTAITHVCMYIHVSLCVYINSCYMYMYIMCDGTYYTLYMSLQAPSFEVYITYCENKPKSESFIWTYMHTGGTFFEVSS